MPSSELARHSPRYDGPERLTPRGARSQSISSDRPSITSSGHSSGLLSPPIAVSPDPQFIAAVAASQIVTNDYDNLSDTWFDQHGVEPSGENALVAPPALKLVNRFLDQLLFNFLTVSRSTSLALLRPAVSEVLKTRLAKDAINGADQELQEYLGSGDEEELAFHTGLESRGDWDLELVWKRTRLRCMVYSSLGDMEEEDEDFYTERDQLEGSSDSSSGGSSVVSPAVAIFLTSILEYMGEQVLVVAGHAAYHRLRAKFVKDERGDVITPVDIADRVVVEESDVERVALDRTLGRLWRGWKKRIRSPTSSISMVRSFAHPHAGRPSNPQEIDDATGRRSLAAILAEQHEHAASFPLPVSVDDVREIEVPGLVEYSDEENETEDISDSEIIQLQPRPQSLTIFTHTSQYLPTPNSSTPNSPIFSPPTSRKRSHSVPSPAPSPYKVLSSMRPKHSGATSDEQQDDNAEVKDIYMDEPEPSNAGGDADADAEARAQAEAKNLTDGTVTEESDVSEGLIAGLVAGAAVVGATALAGIKAVASGQAPETIASDTEEDFNEEPEIMISSRISVAGKVSPDDPKSRSRPASVRSHSVHSLRLIDVASPRSPSRGSSDAISRPASIHSPLGIDTQSPRVTSPIQRGTSASPLARNGSTLSTRARHSAGESISEVDEKDPRDSGPMTALPADFAAAMQGIDFDPSPTSQQFSMETTGKTPPSKPATFVLSPAPAPRHRERTPKDSNSLPLGPGANLRADRSDPSAVPTLTPLREMIENANDTSDETSSIDPNNDAQSVLEYSGYGTQPPISTFSHVHNRPVGQDRSAPAVSRGSPPQPSREEPVPKSLPRAQRSIHTSGSSTSSLSHKLKPLRTSEESVLPNGAENKSQSFEQLIRSDQTIQYTLTPHNMRSIDPAPTSPPTSNSPRHIPPSPPRVTASNSPRSPPMINTHDTAPGPSTARSHSSSVGKYTGLNSNPPIDVPKTARSAKSFNSVQAPIMNTSTKIRQSGPQARDARVDRESLGDFAEFIASTGPPDTFRSSPAKSVVSASKGHRGAGGAARNASSSVPRVSVASTLPKRSESSGGRSRLTRLQPREATVKHDAGLSDLIDVINLGPPRSKEDHRIPRTVAPFRSTMDSDQMSGAVAGRAVDALLPEARSSQVSTNQSFHSSVTSQTGLLNSSTKANKGLPIQNFDEDDMMPKRKTRRVRDPYAIDFSDEEDDFERPTPIKEESLADFLRNAEPPPDDTPPYVFATAAAKPKKKQSFGSRFSRNMSQPPPRSQQAVLRQPTSRQPASPKRVPIASQFASTNNYVSQLDNVRNPPSPRVQQKSYQPRDPVMSTSRTNDLADFFLNEPPPPVMEPHSFALNNTQKEESGNFASRMFGRRKKVAGY
ncbi:hypothetical protein B7494_g3589 [Chlorociboria aeruginascens]|nr:hypothetical protein B7494_g3589 [Chlorociboria aeruginascens]